MLIKAKYKEDRILTYILVLYCWLLPLEEALAGSFGSVVKIIGIIAMAYVVIRFKVIQGWARHLALLVWLLLAVFSVIWAEDYNWWFSFIRIYAAQVAFLVIITSAPTGTINLETLNFGLRSTGIGVAVLLTFFSNISSFTIDGRRSIILFGHVFDPNIVAGLVLLGVGSSIQNFFSQEYRRKIVCLGEILFMSLGIFFTGSRGGLISDVVIIVTCVFLELRIRENKNKARRMVVIIGLAVLVVIPFLPESLLAGRFSAATILGINELNAGVHNRYSIWLSALELIPERPILGYGCGNFLSAITKVYYRSAASHNMYLLLFVEFGFVGLIVFVWYIVSILRKLRKQQLYAIYAILAGVLVMSFTLDALPYKFFWMALLLGQLWIKEYSI